MPIDLGAFGDVYRHIRNDIFKFATACNFEPTPQQREGLEAVQSAVVHNEGSRFIAIKSGKGTGKSEFAALVGLWRTIRYPDALTQLTSPTYRQSKDVYLERARGIIGRMDPEIAWWFTPETTTVKCFGVHDWAIKISASSKDTNVQGTHNPHLTYIIEEASGVKRPIFDAIYSTMTNIDKLVLVYGNPNTRDSAFFDCFHGQRPRWKCMTWNALNSPIVDRDNIERILEQYGEHSDVARISIYGEFPTQDPDCVMSTEDLEKCAELDMVALSRRSPVRRFATDFARFGDDFSVTYRRQGEAIVEGAVFAKKDVDVVAGASFEMQRRCGWRDDQCSYVVDADGPGAGAVSYYRNAGKRYHEFHFGGASSDPMFANKGTEAYFMLADKVKKHEWYLPNDNILFRDLSTRRYYINRKGKIQLEDKDDYMDRFESPDRGDGMVMVNYDQLMIPGRISGSPTASRTTVFTPR